MAVPSSALTQEAGTARLSEFGLAERELQEAGHVGYTAAASCTSNDPRSLPGTLAWAKILGHLRDIKKADGWTADRDSNFETVMHPSRALVIAVAAGTQETGRREGAAPRTRTPKGPITGRAVRRNGQPTLDQGLNIFVGPGLGVAELLDREFLETWMLLHYFDKKEQEIRLELSCPHEMTGRQITAWRERIIVRAVPFSSELEIDFSVEEDTPIDIAVQRKAD